jgi:small multidrug resistance pump
VVIYLNIGVAYAIWSGVGITVTALISRYYFHQRLSLPGKIGMAFVLVGCLVVNL